jgi:hypothetical protein
MASIKGLKKEIDNQLLEVISDSLLFFGLHPGVATEEVNDIVEDAVKLRNDLIAKVNTFKKSDVKGESRKFFNAVTNDLNSGTADLCRRLSAVSSKKK